MANNVNSEEMDRAWENDPHVRRPAVRREEHRKRWDRILKQVKFGCAMYVEEVKDQNGDRGFGAAIGGMGARDMPTLTAMHGLLKIVIERLASECGTTYEEVIAESDANFIAVPFQIKEDRL